MLTRRQRARSLGGDCFGVKQNRGSATHGLPGQTLAFRSLIGSARRRVCLSVVTQLVPLGAVLPQPLTQKG
ncbi:MAG: hypothetical protein JWL97_3573 [Gemmatimonadales bacterium]|nr:hypothetical protein [Gemmatimonadales bacterium]